MDSNVGYIRQTNDDEQPISYEQRYSQYDSQPVGYAEYGHGASESVSLDRNEDFEPPALHHKRPQTDFASVALQVVVSYWIGFFGPLCVVLFGQKILFVQHHGYQGLFVATALWILCLCFVWTWIGLLVTFIFNILVSLTLTIKALMDYESGSCFMLPLIGPFCYRWAQKAEAEGRVV